MICAPAASVIRNYFMRPIKKRLNNQIGVDVLCKKEQQLPIMSIDDELLGEAEAPRMS